MFRRIAALAAVLLVGPLAVASAQVCNLKVVTDASPDYSDMASLVHSVTDRWPAVADKCWAMFYWNHLARRQTTPMDLHGLELTDPIRQFNDYGYTMCSTVAGVNCGIWHAMGLPVRFWDIANHTVPEVSYDGRWHMYDNSMSTLYTLCDGRTIAGVEDIGRDGACAASGGRSERGHVARYHSLNATSPNGFLTGADTQRALDEEARCFNPNALKLRTYYNNWDWGHRYILNLRPGETYTRTYRRLGDSSDYFVSNGGKDPDEANGRYHIRGNGLWTFRADLSPRGWVRVVHSQSGIASAAPAGLRPAKPGQPGVAVYKVQGANVITSQVLRAQFVLGAGAEARLLVSTTNGLKWTEVWRSQGAGTVAAAPRLREQVNGAYEVLVKVALSAPVPAAAVLRSLAIDTVTMLNAKTQPRLNLGRNTVYVAAGDRTESVVSWPELQADRYRELAVEEHNVASVRQHPGYQAALYPARAGDDAWVVYRLDAPRPIRRLEYGGRFLNRAPGSRCELLWSADGRTWTHSWQLTSTEQPWDVVHYEAAVPPAGTRSVWLKYLMRTSDPSPGGCGLYAARMEAHYAPADPTLRPLRVTFCWSERQADRSLVERTHTQTITKLPCRYTIDVGGADHPIVNWLRVSSGDAAGGARDGYSDGNDAGGSRWVGRWVTHGRDLAVGKPYTLSVPSSDNWGAGDPDGRKLTDGVVGPPYAGGISMSYGAIWPADTNPVITLDLGAPTDCGGFGMDVNGYPWWDALKGEVTDRIEVLTSLDGRAFTSRGFLQTDLRWKDVPVNHMLPDDETLTGATFELVPPSPVRARYVQYRVASKRFFDCTELLVWDSVQSRPFDTRIALPDEWHGAGQQR